MMCWIIKNRKGEYLLFTISHLEYLAIEKFERAFKTTWLKAQGQEYKCIAISIKEESDK